MPDAKRSDGYLLIQFGPASESVLNDFFTDKEEAEAEARRLLPHDAYELGRTPVYVVQATEFATQRMLDDRERNRHNRRGR